MVILGASALPEEGLGTCPARTTPAGNPKSELLEWCQAWALPAPVYELVLKAGSEHQPRFTVKVTVHDHGSFVSQERGSLKEAQRCCAASAQAAIQRMQGGASAAPEEGARCGRRDRRNLPCWLGCVGGLRLFGECRT